jgi:hypothetical protein
VLARASEGFSGRDIRDTCESAERALAARIIRGQVCAQHITQHSACAALGHSFFCAISSTHSLPGCLRVSSRLCVRRAACAVALLCAQVGADDLPGLQDYIDAMQLRRTGAGRSGMSTLLRSV